MTIRKKHAAALLLAAICALTASAVFAAVQPVPGKTQSTLSADDIQYNVNTNEAHAKGNVIVKREGSTLTGAEAHGNTEKEIMTISGGVSGDFPEKGVKLVADSATWTGDKTKKTDGTVEAFGKVLLTRAPKDRLNADYVLWQLGTEDYKARGSVDGVFENRALKAAEATRTGNKFWARDVKRYEDMIQKFVLSAKTLDGVLVKDEKTGQETLQEMTADKNVVFDYVDKEGLKTRVTGDKALYSKARGTIVVSGNSKAVRSDGKVVTADTMVMHEDTRNIEAKGNSKITFIVDDKKKNEDKKEDKKDGKTANKKQSKSDIKTKENGAEKTSEPASSDKKPEKPAKDSAMSDSEKSWVEQK
ncbi:MAG: hypothetical protein RR501_04895 [Cloacibacillus sp.]